MLSAMHRLVSLKLLQGTAHEKVEALVTGVRVAMTCFKAVGAVSTLFHYRGTGEQTGRCGAEQMVSSPS